MRGKKHEFKEEDIKYIIENWKKQSPHSMKKKFNCSWYAVCSVAKEHNLELPTSNEWTEEEVKQLKQLSEIYHYTTIAKIMNKTENAIYLKARRLKITLIQDRREWTKEEEEELRELWGYQTIETIAKKLKRTIFSLKVKAIRMNLGSMIDNNYELLTISDISELLNVSRDRISTTWVDLGLKLKKKSLTENKSYYTITLEELIKFLKENQNEWDSRNLELIILGNEPEWLKEKRRRDIKENPLWYRRWTIEEIKQAENMFKSGTDYSTIASFIERSESSVANLLRNMGYSYQLTKYWKDKEIKFLRENYEKMTYEEIAEHLNRTTKAVGAKVSELGYQKTKK